MISKILFACMDVIPEIPPGEKQVNHNWSDLLSISITILENWCVKCSIREKYRYQQKTLQK